MAWVVKFFQTSRGDFPVVDFIRKQDKATHAKVARSIQLLADSGPFLKPPYVKKMNSALYELRISGKVTVRIFYTMSNNRYYLLHAFIKKSQKTPRKEFNIAVDRVKEIV